jgi:flavin-binding protein dodecin
LTIKPPSFRIFELILHDSTIQANFILLLFDNQHRNKKEESMSGKVYKVIELVGTSQANWEISAENAVETVSKSLQDLRVAEISKLDMTVEDGTITDFRTRVKLSFKYATD